ncbi:AraC family transcriptional regulator [Moraxella haemolytica]|uniref:AraC family transcriptional regulator n=1 Tax=Moraxella haemolytica TaxID=2904119 RepID=UPI002543CA45|nr:AraC family transcriptional regulator [Moraxella sp. ZY171148]WII95474.1 AraC family transcriptional regulator [Moraxella sp. ZY171148]
MLDSLLTLAQLHAGVHIDCRLGGEWQIEQQPTAGQTMLHIVTKGTVQLVVKNKTYILKAGDIALFCGINHCIQNVNTGTHRLVDTTCAIQSMSGAFLVNQISNQTDCTMLCLNFYADKHSTLLASLPDFFIVTLNEQTLHPLVALMIDESQNPKQMGNAFLVDNLAQSILVYVLRALPAEKLGGVLRAYQHPRLSELIAKIASKPDDDFSISAMCEQLHLSRSTLVRLFQKTLGVAPHTFVKTMRLEYAAKLLRTNQQSVLQIAIETGFGSQTHFNRAFKAHYGVSPSTYRLT